MSAFANEEGQAQQEVLEVGTPDALQLLMTRLKWRHQDYGAAKSTGRYLVWYAALANDAAAVQLLLQYTSPDCL